MREGIRPFGKAVGAAGFFRTHFPVLGAIRQGTASDGSCQIATGVTHAGSPSAGIPTPELSRFSVQRPFLARSVLRSGSLRARMKGVNTASRGDDRVNDRSGGEEGAQAVGESAGRLACPAHEPADGEGLRPLDTEVHPLPQ